MSARAGTLAVLAPVLGFVALFALVPVAVLIGAVLVEEGAGGLVRGLGDPLNLAALGNSLVQGGLSAAAAVAIGYPAGVFLGRYRWPGRGLVRALLIVPFLLPSLVVIVGVKLLFGPGGPIRTLLPFTAALAGGLPAIVAVNVVFNVPLVVLLTAVGVESVPTPLEESLATLGASPARVYRDAWGPASALGALAGALLTFVFSALAFASPILLCGPRCSTLEVRIYALDQTFLDPAGAAVLAAVTIAVLLAPTLAYLVFVSRLRGRPSAGEQRARPIPWRGAATGPMIAATALLVGTVAVLLGEVVFRGVGAAAPGGPPGSALGYLFGPAGTAVLGLSLPSAIGNTVVFAGSAAAIALLLGISSGFVLGAGRRPGRGLAAVLFLPLLLSPVVLALALATFWRPLLGGASVSWVLIIIAQTLLALPFALEGLSVALARVPRGYREGAQALGARPFSAYLDAELPLVRPALVTAALFAFALGLGEFTATYFLATPATTTLTVALYRLSALRSPGPADAAAALLVLFSLAVFLLIELGGRRVEL